MDTMPVQRITARAHPLNQHYLGEKLSFGVEFEISEISPAVQNEVETVLKHFGWANTSDATVRAEFKSPIYVGYLPVHESRNIFDFFDYCMTNRLMRVTQGAGTHLHIATTDTDAAYHSSGAIAAKLRSDAAGAKRVYQLIRGLEFVIDTADSDWVTSIFGRTFCSRFAKKAYQESPRLRDNVSRLLNDRYHWINLTQSNHGRTLPTIEFRLLQYRDKKQYTAGTKVGIFIFKAIVDVLFNDGNQFAWIEKFEGRCNRIYDDVTKN
jgi:hypothetical protein